MNLKLGLCLACLTLAVLPFLVGLVWLVWVVVDEAYCGEAVYQVVESPRGQFIARVATVGCGLPLYPARANVYLRAAGAALDDKGESVFEFDKPPGAIRLSVAWADEEHLFIERLCVPGQVSRPSSEWRGIHINYRCLDHHPSNQRRSGASRG